MALSCCDKQRIFTRTDDLHRLQGSVWLLLLGLFVILFETSVDTLPFPRLLTEPWQVVFQRLLFLCFILGFLDHQPEIIFWLWKGTTVWRFRKRAKGPNLVAISDIRKMSTLFPPPSQWWFQPGMVECVWTFGRCSQWFKLPAFSNLVSFWFILLCDIHSITLQWIELQLVCNIFLKRNVFLFYSFMTSVCLWGGGGVRETAAEHPDVRRQLSGESVLYFLCGFWGPNNSGH